jgi:hypothetical protein
MPYDRDEVLARTDLGVLADELLGPHRGRGRSATWPCPDPGHGPQTGRTPPVSMFTSSSGQERWRCHACSAGGTAADLVMTTQGVNFGEALALLARRVGLGERDSPPGPLRRATVDRRPVVTPIAPDGAIEDHVAACEALLWSPAGGPMRAWLARRGLGEEVLRANRVGADPGPRSLPRPAGLPRSGPAVILPVLDPDGLAVYLQARYLRPPGGRKYENPASALAGPSPRLAQVRTSRSAIDAATVVVCEGLPDALIAAQAGHRATALLGAGLPDDRVARLLVERFPVERLVVAFDADDRGRAGSARLRELLAAAGAADRTAVLDVPTAWGDLNGWHLAAGSAFERELVDALARSVQQPGLPEPHRRDDGLADRLETIRYRHLLIDDPLLASRNLSRARGVVARWERNGITVDAPRGVSRRSGIEEDLGELAYQHLLGADASDIRPSLSTIKATVADWSRGIEGRQPGHDQTLAAGRARAGVARTMAPERSLGIDL